MKFSWIRTLNVIFAIILIAGIGFGGYYFVTSKPVKSFWADWVLNKHEHYLDCYDLPFNVEVEKAVAKHQKEIKEIVDLGAVNVKPISIKCKVWEQGIEFVKGDLLINFHTRSQKNAIEKYLGKTFFGVPYRLEPIK